MEYIKISPNECKQLQGRRLGTPCFNNMTRDGVVCAGLCPVELATATDPEETYDLLHKKCILSDTNPDGVSAHLKSIITGHAIAIPSDINAKSDINSRPENNP
jgi:hypothetical protein